MRLKLTAKKTIVTLVALVAALGSPMAVYAGYAPANRPTFQCITPTNCPGANYVVFNSFTNAPNYGDERAFFDGKDAHDTSANGYKDNVAVQNGQLLTLRVYIHNDANPNAIGVAAATAHNTTMTVLLPKNQKTTNFAAASISASNANPVNVSDTVDFTGARPFSVTFDKTHPAQITYRPNGAGDFVTRTLQTANYQGDSVLSANFGDWKGCFNFSALVTMTVKVNMPEQPQQPAYSCDAFNITADVNRTVRVTNFNTTATGGATFTKADVNWGDNSAVTTDTNIIGKTHQYAKDGTYTIQATAHFNVNGQDKTADGAQCAKTVTFKSKTPPHVTPPTTTPSTPSTLVNTGPGQIAGLFAAVTIAGAAAHRRFLSRRLSRQ